MVLWWIGNLLLLLVVAPLVVALAQRVVDVAREIGAHADDILEHGVLLAGALDPVPALVQTQSLVGEVTANAVDYVSALQRKVGGAA